MPSPFFRSPLDDTDTSHQSDTSASYEDDHEEVSESLNEPGNVYDLARTRSAASTSIEELSRSLPQNHVGGQIFDHREGVLHALLERNCLLEAVEDLNRTRNPKHDRLYTKDDPEVKARAKANFFKVASSLAAHGISKSGLHRDEFKPIRDNYNQALDVAKEPGDGALERLRKKSPDQDMYRSSDTLELTDHAHDTSPQRSPIRYGQVSPGHPPDILQGIVGNPHPLLPPSFSMASFYNLQIIGKGGYGTVFSGYHPLDGGFYAIKQIPLSASRMRNIRSKGQAELDAILKEVRAMQGFDHPNIVRYHSAWLERPSGNLHHLVKTNQKLLEFGSTNLSTDMGSSEDSGSVSGLEQTFDSRLDLSSPDDGIVFGEDSAPGPTVHTGYHLNVSRNRHQSHLTSSSPAKSERPESELGDPIDFLSPPKEPRRRRESHNTLSSSVSKKSFVHSTDDEFDEEVERDFANLTLSGPRENSFEMDMVFEDDYHTHQQRRPDPRTPRCSDIAQVNLALHIQMALYPMTLADYLKIETDYLTVGSGDDAKKKTDEVNYRHCFHVKPSLQILLAILDGVQYLHAHNMVHRDLKPANIFLSPCEQAYRHKGHVHLGVCSECAKAGPCKDIQMGVRIGDFGLVTELARPGGDQAQSPEKAVGTEFYRPPGPSRQPSEKLDVFSLGVIAFELLWKFDTKSERIHTLSELKLGRLPPLFAPKLEGCGMRIAELLQGMLRGDDDHRLSCAEVQKELEDIIAGCDT
ncbi:Eukaryotic translation initiation factor 2-alpha kinase 1 [Diplodia seriata]|uniref:Eukaryotic translation initiation factor 2-alpha kinase 1 n=1 Tax=Diplodia seriata TaxID=420778 RepID=A0A1S8BLF8_9PEZI|nr:Eukaryotic translation initiation factor 2-alpha kinase 1 [Diplodia seriata]